MFDFLVVHLLCRNKEKLLSRKSKRPSKNCLYLKKSRQLLFTKDTSTSRRFKKTCRQPSDRLKRNTSSLMNLSSTV